MTKILIILEQSENNQSRDKLFWAVLAFWLLNHHLVLTSMSGYCLCKYRVSSFEMYK